MRQSVYDPLRSNELPAATIFSHSFSMCVAPLPPARWCTPPAGRQRIDSDQIDAVFPPTAGLIKHGSRRFLCGEKSRRLLGKGRLNQSPMFSGDIAERMPIRIGVENRHFLPVA